MGDTLGLSFMYHAPAAKRLISTHPLHEAVHLTLFRNGALPGTFRRAAAEAGGAGGAGGYTVSALFRASRRSVV